jgi:hypothetical protein
VGTIRLYVSMSVDGFVTGPGGDAEHGLGVGGVRLAGLLDELELQLMPVLLGRGRRLFDDLPPDHRELDLLRSLEGPGVLHLRYRVRTAG